MFRKGDTIVYATTGVCVIDDIREQACTGEVHTYYVLQPVFDSSSKVFAPVGASEQKMRAVLTAGEADELVRALPDAPADWIDNDTRRKETFSAMLRSGNRGELVRLVKRCTCTGWSCSSAGANSIWPTNVCCATRNAFCSRSWLTRCPSRRRAWATTCARTRKRPQSADERGPDGKTCKKISKKT